MNFDKFMPFILIVVLATSTAGKIDDLQEWIGKLRPMSFMSPDLQIN